MKRIIYTAIFLSASWLTGCQEAEYLLFNDIARVQMDEEDEIRTSFYYTDASINRDTVYLTVNTIGDPEDRVRHIAMEQISEYDVEYKYDEKGNLIDSVLTEKPVVISEAATDIANALLIAEAADAFVAFLIF